MPALTRTDLTNAKTDVDKISEFMESSSETMTTRLGETVRTRVGLSAEFPNAEANAAAAAASAEEAVETAAEIADLVDTLLSAGKVYVDTATGLANTSGTGDTDRYFFVPSAVSGESLILYRNNAGSAVEVKRFLSTDAIAVLETNPSAGVAYAISDASGRTAVAVLDDGTTEIATLEAETINGVDAGTLSNLEALESSDVDGVAFGVADASGRTALAVLDSGETEIKNLTVETINGQDAASFGSSTIYAGTYLAEMVGMNFTGQSLMEGSNGTITTAQEHDNLGFAAHSSSPGATVTLTVANTEVTGRGESPMYGALDYLKDLVADENGLEYGDHNFTLIGCNNAYSGYSITQLLQGTAAYIAALSQVTSGKTIANAASKTYKAGVSCIAVGETDSIAAMSKATYKAHLIDYATDWDADCKAITGQTEDVPTITYQTATTANRDVAVGQLEASEESDLVYMACPMYQFDYYDSLHIDAASSRWLGAYLGLAAKRIMVDGENWRPVQPISFTKQGAILTVKFHVPVLPLVLDTLLVPAQTNYGFTAVDSGGSALTINSVTQIQPDELKFVFSASIPVGAKLRGGFNTATGKSPFTGGALNLRDSQGDQLPTHDDKTMHNWCAIFELAL